MPTYDYMCDSCKITFEVQHKMTDNPVIVCPQCGAPAHQILSAGFGLNFTGKGFYQTDTRNTASSVPSSAGKTDRNPAAAEKNVTTPHSCTGGCGCPNSCACSS